ncbi:hypothetical protein [Halobacillus ihumii]|uniref:hypothetical protein n=1 Tax=Halobacillus ihumii TaxID=2686092 RepID=UPI0013D2722E|nr:hypothetical protein [Halobacillus ihumii]
MTDKTNNDNPITDEILNKVKSIHTNLNEFRSETRLGFNEIHKHFDTVNTRFNGINTELSNLNARLERIAEKKEHDNREITQLLGNILKNTTRP